MIRIGRPRVRNTTTTASQPTTTPTTTTTTARRSSTTPMAPGTRTPATTDPAASAATVKASLAALRATDPAAAATKAAKLAVSPFSFFRGTVEIFAAQHGRASQGAQVLLNGDVHPMNFGFLDDGGAVLGLNDFDEACRGAFSYDVKRGAAGFALLCQEQKLDPKDAVDVVEAFADAYVDAIKEAAAGKKVPAVIDDNDAHGAVKDGLERASRRSRAELLADATDGHGKLKPGTGLTARPGLISDVQRALVHTAPAGKDAAFLVVKDVAEKTGAGIGSLGARRLLVLVEGSSKNGHDDIVLELKQATPPALLSSSPTSTRSQALRVARAAHAQTRGTDRFSSTTIIGGESFVVRERSPQRMPLDLFKMGKPELTDVARACGAVLAGAHVGADKSKREKTAERIVSSMGPKREFVTAMTAFAQQEATTTTAAFAAFKAG
ncbi:MAG: DUF2252 family protein [Deltaproteobacteria bacterium]|nr:DUF2252 family protein [Deltaproteobacteria bacterium]